MNQRLYMASRKFSRDFKIRAVRLVTDWAVPVAQAARDLDIAESVLRRWIRELSVAPATAFRGDGQIRADVTESHRFKKRGRPATGKAGHREEFGSFLRARWTFRDQKYYGDGG
jgi:transposase